MLETLGDMAGRVLSGLLGDAWRLVSGWAAAHPGAAVGVAVGWWGVGSLGRQAARAVLPRELARLAVVFGPPLLVWGLCRRTRSGRRGLVVAAPVCAGLLLVGMWWYAPEWRRGAVVWLALLTVGGLASWLDHWLGGVPWSWRAVREAWERDDAHQALRAGVEAVAPGSKVGKPRLAGGQIVVPVRTENPGAVVQGAADERLGATAAAHGTPVAGVVVGAGDAQGELLVRGVLPGQPDPLSGTFEYRSEESW